MFGEHKLVHEDRSVCEHIEDSRPGLVEPLDADLEAGLVGVEALLGEELLPVLAIDSGRPALQQAADRQTVLRPRGLLPPARAPRERGLAPSNGTKVGPSSRPFFLDAIHLRSIC